MLSAEIKVLCLAIFIVLKLVWETLVVTIIFLFSSLLQKENEHANEQKTAGHPESKVPTKPGSSPSKKSTPEHPSEKRPQIILTPPDDFSPWVRDDEQTSHPSSLKRTFSDVEKSPELSDLQAKKSTADYKRCFEIPEETAMFHTGLTGIFNNIQIGDFIASTEGIGSDQDDCGPKRSSPIAVAKSLFCELEEPTEDVFENGAKDASHSSFTSPLAGNADICRSLSLDSDESVHETSLTIESKCRRNRHLDSSEEHEESKDSSIIESLPHTPSIVASETPKLGHFGWRGESKSPSFLSQRPDLACSVSQSPSFLKPKNVVAFRSYCSSINRSNMSRLSFGSLESMDVSSYHCMSGNATPVQRRSNSNRSICQV